MRGVGLVLICSLLLPGTGFAAGKKRKAEKAEFNGKKVLSIDPIRNVRIEMPDGQFHDFGDDFVLSLTSNLIGSGKYLTDAAPVPEKSEDSAIGKIMSALSKAKESEKPQVEWPSSFVPAARIQIQVEALSFQTGAGGDRMFYGFNERYRTPFNNGYEDLQNEFPLRTVSFEPNWFDRTFDRIGKGLTHSQVGLDLGDGLDVNILFAWMSIKYALYRTELRLRLDIDAPLAGRKEFRIVHVKGKGYFFDVAGAYLGYSAGIRVARKDAMNRALKNAIDGAYSAIDRAVMDLPLTARVDHLLPDGRVLLGTGINARIRSGTQYELVADPSVVVEVDANSSSGAVAKVVQGNAQKVALGMELREVLDGQPAPNVQAAGVQLGRMSSALSASAKVDVGVEVDYPAAVESIELAWKDLPASKLGNLAPVISWAKALLKSFGGMFILPYRLARYKSYDQSFLPADRILEYDGMIRGQSNRKSEEGVWAKEVRNSALGKQISLNTAPQMVDPAPTVAVIDTGVDYNHWTLYAHLWLNPKPAKIEGAGMSGAKDLYGWDFVSGDARPYDDGYHGTEVASLISAIAPFSPIMPIKVFNPWGITSSAALVGAFRYAVDHGAKIIVCAWATRMQSKAIQQGVDYARVHGVVVVAAAGDRGDHLSEVASYPAILAQDFDNVLTVANVTAQDQLVKVSGKYSNYDRDWVGIAAPAQNVRVSTPRGEQRKDTSTGLAAAMVAGAMARLLADEPSLWKERPAAWIEQLRADADEIPGLVESVKGGRRLRVRH